MVAALESLYRRGVPGAKRAIEDNVDLIVASLKRREWSTSYHAAKLLAAIKSPKAVAALRWAAESHPTERIRKQARELLPRE